MNVNFLKSILKQRKISVYRLSKLTNISDGRLNEIINKKTINPRINTIISISEALDLSCDEFAKLCEYKNK